MFWGIALPAGAGLLSGFLFRVPFLIVLSLLTAFMIGAVNVSAGTGILATVMEPLIAVCALQFGYLAGLLGRCLSDRV